MGRGVGIAGRNDRARAVAVGRSYAEHCLSRFLGIGALAKRVWLLCSGLVVAYSCVAARINGTGAPIAERSVGIVNCPL